MNRTIKVLLERRFAEDIYPNVEEFYDTRKYLEIVQEINHITIRTRIARTAIVQYVVTEER